MPSFGERLKREREQRSITLDDLSASTKISTRLLRALEDEHFDQLPGGIFNKGFVRAYARQLGLDEEQAVSEYLEAATDEGTSDSFPHPTFPLEIREEHSLREPLAARIPWAGLAILLLIIGILFAAWGLFSRRGTPQSRPASQQSSTQYPVNAVQPPNSLLAA